DTDGDGIPDLDEGTTDTDGDGIPDFRDEDSDGDGIPDDYEGNTDFDGDGIPDYLDTDSDNDSILDNLEGNDDVDGDGLPNYLDTDSDNDGITDEEEGMTDTDGDLVSNYLDFDSDNDGAPDAFEGNSDKDSDGTPNYLDQDSDNDGILDTIESQVAATDSDGDGIVDVFDVDTKGGVDIDYNGISDEVALLDSDSDGIPDLQDVDSDNDSLSDAYEAGFTSSNNENGQLDSFVDTDGDGIDDNLDLSIELKDHDQDGIFDYLDLDSDNDGITDLKESEGVDDDHDGRIDSFIDNDENGFDDIIDLSVTDTDGDGTPDHLDLDSDNDGIFDLIEAGGESSIDANGDGIVDGTIDADQDGIMDDFDGDINGDNSKSALPVPDTDGDGNYDFQDIDADNDGIPDEDETATDSDGDGTPDYLQPVSGGSLQTAVSGGGSSSIWLLIALAVVLLARGRSIMKKESWNTVWGVLVLVIFLPVISYADQSDNSEKLYWGLGYGYSQLEPKGQAMGWSTNDSSSDGYIVYIGYKIDPQWSLQLAYADPGEAGVGNISPLIEAQVSNPNIDYEIPSLMAQYSFLETESEIDVYVTFGLANINNSAHEQIPYSKESSVQLAFGLGLQWDFTEQWFLRAEWDSYAEDAWMTSIQLGSYF
ncbi:MAG: outer membrane beta-barrel protein, partial [Kangiella sp.]|nr:outer membrane beta-barrel protein [Kangiella sp.]